MGIQFLILALTFALNAGSAQGLETPETVDSPQPETYSGGLLRSAFAHGDWGPGAHYAVPVDGGSDGNAEQQFDRQTARRCAGR